MLFIHNHGLVLSPRLWRFDVHLFVRMHAPDQTKSSASTAPLRIRPWRPCAADHLTPPDRKAFHPLLWAAGPYGQSWNLYAYARNNPLAFVDPSGLACVYAGADNGTAADYADPANYIDDNNGGQTCAEVDASPPEEEDVSAFWNNDPQSDDFGNVTFFATATAQNPGQSSGPQLVPKTTVAQCMLQNQDSFSLAALVDQGAGMIGLHTNVSNTFVGNLLLGNDVMGFRLSCLATGAPKER